MQGQNNQYQRQWQQQQQHNITKDSNNGNDNSGTYRGNPKILRAPAILRKSGQDSKDALQRDRLGKSAEMNAGPMSSLCFKLEPLPVTSAAASLRNCTWHA